MRISFQPMPLARKTRPFNHPEWLFELKYDGFRALARIERGRAQLTSRNGHPFASFSDLTHSMTLSVPSDIVLDGEIVCLDRKGRPQFNDLLFRRGKVCFFAFDLLYADGKDWRRDSLVERKAALRQMIHRLPADSRVRYADHVERSGVELFERVSNLLHLKWRNEGRAICGGCLVFVAGLCSVVELELLNGDVSSSPIDSS